VLCKKSDIEIDINPEIVQTLDHLECLTFKKDEEPLKQLGKLVFLIFKQSNNIVFTIYLYTS